MSRSLKWLCGKTQANGFLFTPFTRFVFNLRNATGGHMLWITKGTTTLTLGASASQAPTSLAPILLRWTVKKKNRSLLIISKADSNLIIWLDNPRNCWRLMLWNKMFYYSHQDKEKTEEWSKVCKCDYNMCKWTVSAAILVGIKEVTLTATYHPGISPITKHI